MNTIGRRSYSNNDQGEALQNAEQKHCAALSLGRFSFINRHKSCKRLFFVLI